MGLGDRQTALRPRAAQGTVPAPAALLTPAPTSKTLAPFPLSFCVGPCRGRGFGPPCHPVPGVEWPPVTPTMRPSHLPAKNMPP